LHHTDYCIEKSIMKVHGLTKRTVGLTSLFAGGLVVATLAAVALQQSQPSSPVSGAYQSEEPALGLDHLGLDIDEVLTNKPRKEGAQVLEIGIDSGRPQSSYPL
jgi:hypothetical protein